MPSREARTPLTRILAAAILAMAAPAQGWAASHGEGAALSRILQGRGVVAVNMGAKGIKDLRLRVLRRTAFTVGVQAGAHWQYARIDKTLMRNARALNGIFRFGPLLLDHGRVLPPVIASVRGGIRLDSARRGSSVIQDYQILKPARLVSMPPSWRSYLVRRFPPLSRISRLLLPKNSREWHVWRTAVRQGWAQGVREALAVYESELHSLTRDYIGIVRFHALARQKIVSVPELATGDLGIVVNGKRLAIGQRIFRITWPAHFTKPAGWRVRAVARGKLPRLPRH